MYARISDIWILIRRVNPIDASQEKKKGEKIETKGKEAFERKF